MFAILWLVPLLWLVEITAGAKILCIFPTPFYSHQSVFQPVWLELTARGHEVTVLTTNLVENQTANHNLKQIDLGFSHKLVFQDLHMQEIVHTESNLLVLTKHVYFVSLNLTEEQLKHKDVQTFIRSNQTFDLVIVEAHIQAWFGFAAKYNCPIIAVTSMEPTNYLRRTLGNSNSPISSPHVNLPFGQSLTFLERIASVLFDLLEAIVNDHLGMRAHQNLIRKYLGTDDVNLAEIIRNNISLLITNVVPGFNRVTPIVPSILQVNGLHIKRPQSLPHDLKQFLDGAHEGAIYFSLGSTLKSFLIPEERKRVLLEVFAELPYKIIWKLEKDIAADSSAKVKVLAWAPQQDILRHKNVKLFITQGGIQSVEESMQFGVPILGFPFFGDQFYNVKRAEQLGIGLSLDFEKFSKQILKQTIVELINNTTYKERISEMSELLNEQPMMNSLDKAVWWIEYVLKFKGARHLRSPLADMPFYQYYMFDVITFLIIVTAIVLFLIYHTCRLAKKLVCLSFTRRNNKPKRE